MKSTHSHRASHAGQAILRTIGSLLFTLAIRVALAALALATLLARPAHAHQASVTYARVLVDDTGQLSYTIDIARPDLAEALGLPAGTAPNDHDLHAGRPRLFAYVGQKLAAFDGSTRCPLRPGDLAIHGDTITLAYTATCPGPIHTLVLDYDLFFDLDARHTAFLTVTLNDEDGETVQRELSSAASRFEWALDTAPPPSTSFLDFLASGVDHIFTGYDHICFLLALLFVTAVRGRPPTARPPRAAALDILRTVTAFTLAHSLTLVLAALGWLALPTRLVESAIAASIVYVAAENLFTRARRGHTQLPRWPLAFAFGLVHGLGFAAMLAPLLPPDAVVVPLLAFNLGVELGQLAIVAIALPALLYAAARSPTRYDRFVVAAGSALIGLFGLYWLVQRAFT